MSDRPIRGLAQGSPLGTHRSAMTRNAKTFTETLFDLYAMMAAEALDAGDWPRCCYWWQLSSNLAQTLHA